jgi:hypothetical protein
MRYTFGDIVVVDGENIGVVVKSWVTMKKGENSRREDNSYEVYVRMYNRIKEYPESEIERYMVRHKYLSAEEKQYQYNALNNL